MPLKMSKKKSTQETDRNGRVKYTFNLDPKMMAKYRKKAQAMQNSGKVPATFGVQTLIREILEGAAKRWK